MPTAVNRQVLLAADPVNLQKIREIVSDIVADDKRAGDVIRRLRALVKKGDLEQVALDLNEVVSEVAWLVRNDAVIRNVSMSVELAADLPRVRGDRVQLQQVVLNLVLNGLALVLSMYIMAPLGLQIMKSAEERLGSGPLQTQALFKVVQSLAHTP